MPSHRVKTTGRYLVVSVLKAIVAPAATCRFTRLLNRMGPVRKSPGGTTTRPPPRREIVAIAAAKAREQSVTPSPTAPKSVTLTSWWGNRGARTRRLIRSAVFHGSASAVPAAPVAAPVAPAARAAWAEADAGHREAARPPPR